MKNLKNLKKSHLILILGLLVISLVACVDAPVIRDNRSEIGRSFNSLKNYSEPEAVSLVVQLIKWPDKHKQTTWPSFKFSELPTLVHFANGHIYAIGLNSTDSRWSKLSFEGHHVLFSEVDYWGISNVTLTPAFPIEGKIAYVFKLDFKGQVSESTFITFLHERFHAHQFMHFSNLGLQSSLKYSAHTNEENVALIALENSILKNWMSNRSVEMLKDFLAVNALRLKLLDKESMAWEESQQRMEGLADYISWKISEKSELITLSNLKTRLQSDSEKYFSLTQDGIDNVIKWRHYLVGALLGEALDLYGPKNWKDTTEKKGQSSIDILRNSVQLNESEKGTRVVQAKRNYKYDDLKTEVKTSISKYLSLIQTHTKEFSSLPGIQLAIGNSNEANCSGGGYSERTFYLSNGGKLDLSTSGYHSCGKTIKADYKNIPILFTEPRAIRLKINADTQITIGSHSVTARDILRAKDTQAFENIKLTSPDFNFESTGLRGKIRVDQNQLVLEFDKDRL